MRLTTEELSEIRRLHKEANALRDASEPKKASASDSQALLISNMAALQMLEAGDILNKDPDDGEFEEFIFTDLSLPMPLEDRNRKGYILSLALIEGSPLAQEILAVLKKHEKDVGRPNTTPADDYDEVLEITF